MISVLFLLYFCFLVYLERNTLYLTVKYKMCVVFLYTYCYYESTAKNVDDNMIYLC